MSSSSRSSVMTEEERYLFDTNGFLVVKGVFSEAEVQAANASIDAHASGFLSRIGPVLRNTQKGSPLEGDKVTPRKDMGGFLGWEKPHSEFFRRVLDHKTLLPYYHEMLGMGYRLDHSPLIFTQSTGSEGFTLHGGARSADGSFNHDLGYSCIDGRMRNSMLGVSVVLTDTNEGDGGFCVLKGSHKSSFPCPKDFAQFLTQEGGEDAQSHVFQPITKAGDVLLFSEGTTHGTLPWQSDKERRVALYRLAPATHAYGRAYLSWPPSFLEGMTESQVAVMSPPYGNRLDRLELKVDYSKGGGGETVVAAAAVTRSKEKKEFDQQLFGSDYF